MARNSIGLDVGSRAVRLAEVQMVGGRPAVTSFGRALLPPGAVVRGEVKDPQAVGQAIKALWKRLGLSGRSVRVALANARVAVRTIELPALEGEDLDGAVRFQAAEHIPIPLDQAVMGYEVLEKIEDDQDSDTRALDSEEAAGLGDEAHHEEPGEPTEASDEDGAGGAPAANGRLRVLVTAAERGAIESLVAATRVAGLDVESVELDAYPLVRCFAADEGTEAVVDIGGGVTTIVVVRDGKIRLTRILPSLGGEDFTQAVAEGLEMEPDKAEALKREASKVLRERATQPRLPAPALAAAPAFGGTDGSLGESFGQGGSWSELGGPGGEEEDAAHPRVEPDDQRAAGLIEPLIDRLVSEVRGSVDFYSGQGSDPAVDRVVITGGGSLLGGLREELEAQLGVPVVAGDAFQKAPIAKVTVSDQEKKTAEPFLGVAVGLALAGMRR